MSDNLEVAKMKTGHELMMNAAPTIGEILAQKDERIAYLEGLVAWQADALEFYAAGNHFVRVTKA